MIWVTFRCGDGRSWSKCYIGLKNLSSAQSMLLKKKKKRLSETVKCKKEVCWTWCHLLQVLCIFIRTGVWGRQCHWILNFFCLSDGLSRNLQLLPRVCWLTNPFLGAKHRSACAFYSIIRHTAWIKSFLPEAGCPSWLQAKALVWIVFPFVSCKCCGEVHFGSSAEN